MNHLIVNTSFTTPGEKQIPPLPLLAIGGSSVPPAAQKKREKIEKRKNWSVRDW